MSKEFLIVEKSLLPKCFEKVVEAKEMLNNNESITNILKQIILPTLSNHI